jgi:hypothetical protein
MFPPKNLCLIVNPQPLLKINPNRKMKLIEAIIKKKKLTTLTKKKLRRIFLKTNLCIYHKKVTLLSRKCYLIKEEVAIISKNQIINNKHLRKLHIIKLKLKSNNLIIQMNTASILLLTIKKKKMNSKPLKNKFNMIHKKN